MHRIKGEWTNASSGGYAELWFRGVRDTAHKLIPSIYRQPKINTFADNEPGMLEVFKSHTMGLGAEHPTEDWDWYFFAQHYGHPTRLLDWTESLATALYFYCSGNSGRQEWLS